MKKSTIILGVIFTLMFGFTIYTIMNKFGKKEVIKEERKLVVGNINIKLSDNEHVKISNATKYNIDLLNNIEKFIIDTDDKVINSNEVVKSDTCKGTIDYKKLNDGIYKLDIDSSCNDDEGNYFSLKVLGNLNNNGNLYNITETSDGFIAASYIKNGYKTSSIIKFDKELDIIWSHDIDYTLFNLSKDSGIEVSYILENKNDYYVVGYLNDDDGTPFVIKLNDGNKVWHKKLNSDMIISNAFIVDDNLVIIDGKEITIIDEKTSKMFEFDLDDKKLSNFIQGKLVYYNNNYYISNIKETASFAEFNTSGLANQLYIPNLDNVGYLNTLHAYDNKLFFNYENGKIIVVDIFGRYIGTIDNENKVNMYTNKDNFSVITTNEGYYRLDKYDYKLKKINSYDILILDNEKNLFDTNDKLYEYVYDDKYIVFFEFDKN